MAIVVLDIGGSSSRLATLRQDRLTNSRQHPLAMMCLGVGVSGALAQHVFQRLEHAPTLSLDPPMKLVG